MARSPKSPPVGNPQRLHWDGVRLWAGDRVIRPFKRSAPRQAALLAVFEAQQWSPKPVPDPFPREGWEEPEDVYRRLRSAVENLNRTQCPQKVRFRLTNNCVWCEPISRRGRRVGRLPAARWSPPG